MIVFENGMDSRCRDVPPQVAKFHVGDGTYVFVIIGTDYGYIHTSGGDVRTWRSRSGAYRYLRGYTPL